MIGWDNINEKRKREKERREEKEGSKEAEIERSDIKK